MQFLNPLWLALAALLVSVGLAGVVAWLWRRVNRYQGDLNRVANAREIAPTAELVRHWKIEQNKYPPGSPKHTAYTNRLKELGC